MEDLERALLLMQIVREAHAHGTSLQPITRAAQEELAEMAQSLFEKQSEFDANRRERQAEEAAEVSREQQLRAEDETVGNPAPTSTSRTIPANSPDTPMEPSPGPSTTQPNTPVTAPPVSAPSPAEPTPAQAGSTEAPKEASPAETKSAGAPPAAEPTALRRI